MRHHTKILIVEDDELIRRMYQQIFAFRGYKVDIAADGREGLSKATDGGYALILLDIMMPKLNGIAMLHALKESPKGRATPVVILTNLMGTADAEAALAAGAIKFICKSDYSPKDVVDMVEDLLTPPTK